MKILFTNNYDTSIKEAEYSSGACGAEHLWGIPALREYGHQVDILPFLGGDLNMGRWGSQAQQWRILKRRDYDLLYIGAHGLVNMLAFLRSFRMFHRPILAICHHGLPGGRVAARQALGFDRLIFISREIERLALELHPSLRRRVAHLDWGFDLAFHRAVTGTGQYLVSAGKTGRDYNTLCLALSQEPVPARIFCSSESAPTVPIATSVTVVAGAYRSNPVSDLEMQGWYAKAFAVAVPLQDQPYLLGLTSVLDAMAHGKAVILTKTPYIDIDVDAEGCGISVAPGDVDGWANAIAYLRDHPSEAERMGRRGRTLSEQRYNSMNFGRSLTKLIEDFIRESRPNE